MSKDQSNKIDNRQLRRDFEMAAQDYDSVAVLQNEICERLLARLELIKIKPRTVLDVGAGTGKATQHLLKCFRGANVIALDIAMAMLQKTKQRCGWLRKPALVCADAECLPLAEASVDLLFSNLTLQWCNDLEKTLHGFKHTLAPGGLLLFTTFGPDTLQELRNSWSEIDGHTHVNDFIDMHDIGDALLRAGFSDPVMDMEMMYLTYSEVMQLMRELKLIGARNKTIGRALHLTGKGKLQRLFKAYERFRNKDGLLPASYEVIYGHAWKMEKRPAAGQTHRPDEFYVPLDRIKKGGAQQK